MDIPLKTKRHLLALKQLFEYPPAVKGRGRTKTVLELIRETKNRFGISQPEMIEMLSAWNQVRCHPPCSEDKIDRLVDMVYENASPQPRFPRSVIPSIDYDALHMALGAGPSKTELSRMSPLGEKECREKNFLPLLFPPLAQICASYVHYKPFILRVENFTDDWYRSLQFIVPSPMSKPSGLNKSGEPSIRCDDTVGPRLFGVVEWDFDPATVTEITSELSSANTFTSQDCNAALTYSLAAKYRLAMIVDTSGKSLHSWFDVSGLTQQEIDHLYAEASALGADPQMRIRSQWVRMPNGTRANGGGQRVIYFDPTKLPRTI